MNKFSLFVALMGTALAYHMLEGTEKVAFPLPESTWSIVVYPLILFAAYKFCNWMDKKL